MNSNRHANLEKLACHNLSLSIFLNFKQSNRGNLNVFACVFFLTILWLFLNSYCLIISPGGSIQFLFGARLMILKIKIHPEATV